MVSLIMVWPLEPMAKINAVTSECSEIMLPMTPAMTGRFWFICLLSAPLLSFVSLAHAQTTPEPTVAAPAVPADTPVVAAPPTDGVPPAAVPTDGTNSQGTSAAAVAPVVPTEIEAVRAALADKAIMGSAHGDDVAALQKFYAGRQSLHWVVGGAFSQSAQSAISEMKKADDYGLDASAFVIPELAPGATLDAQAQAEAKLALSLMKYARHARGGRVEPVKMSSMLDVKPDIKDPNIVIGELAASSTPDAVLRGLHPKHAEFEGLRQALLKARGPAVEAEPIDPALLIKIPAGKTLKPGAQHDDAALLRQRLKAPANSEGNDRLFDEQLVLAVKAFQESNGIKPTGQLTAKTRNALNAEAEPKVADPKRDVDRLIVNMERWRWLPDDLGALHVMNNVPEFMTRVVKNNENIFEERIIVGLPTWPTPMLTDSMERIVFNPEWGVPDGIKVKELLPRLKRASSQYSGGFFDQLFSGGSSGGARVLAAYGLKPSINGRPVNADSVDWNRVDIRRYSFVQPAGSKNPLGNVKFMFPNTHDVYMHDTSSRNLFAQSRRALSHGCIRVQNPRKLAEVLLAEDKGWSPEKVSSQYGGGTNDVVLDKPIPVYLVYFTARPGTDGKVTTYSDIYGHDSRLMSALSGKPVRYAPEKPADDQIADSSDATVVYNDEPVASPSKKNSNKNTASRKSQQTSGDLISNALSGLLTN